MYRAGPIIVLWTVFALVILTGGYAMLRACDLGFLPLFENTCEAPAFTTALMAERAKQASLRFDMHAAEIRLALLPICPRRVSSELPKGDELQSAQKFEVPRKVEDLKGCWQSSHGDIDIVSDDAEQRHLGRARFCYCFRSDGQGTAQIHYTDGEVCSTGLTARILPDSVLMHHEAIDCRKNTGLVAADITCSNDGQSNETNCEIAGLGQRANKVIEQFVHVSDDYCGWSG
jgi:hypothetical protein